MTSLFCSPVIVKYHVCPTILTAFYCITILLTKSALMSEKALLIARPAYLQSRVLGRTVGFIQLSIFCLIRQRLRYEMTNYLLLRPRLSLLLELVYTT